MLKNVCWLVALAVCLQRAAAFSLLGPNNEAYQVPANGFNPLPFDSLPTGPKNLGEEYRRNVPVMYYAFDANFLDYFGSNGVAAVESAIAIFNDVTNVSQYSSDLSEWPLQTQSVNYQAQALFLTDLKSMTMHLMTEQLGLASPDRYTWVLHDRFQEPGFTCPAGMDYLVVQRNFDPATYEPSSFVNGSRYSYVILEFCVPTPPILADAAEFPVDPLADSFSAVAGIGDIWGLTINGGLTLGGYYSGLTRDDVGGLRYLLNTNNVNYESTGIGTVTFSTNKTNPQLLYTSNLTVFAQQALTNTPAALQALYPGLVILDSQPYFTNVLVTNIVNVFSNSPFDPFGTPPRMVSITNIVPDVQERFKFTFGNVVTNHPQVANGFSLLITTNISSTACGPFSAFGSICTNVTVTTIPGPSGGDFFLIPSNLCGIQIVSTQLVRAVYTTNTSVFATNSTDFLSVLFSQTTVDVFTQYVYVINPIDCISNQVGLHQGIEHIQFIRANYDSLLGQAFTPITNIYNLNGITNSQIQIQRVRRVITRPDFLFSAADIASGPGDLPVVNTFTRTVFNWVTNNATGQALAGPGTIDTSPNVISFDKVGPIYLNTSPNAYFMATAEASQQAVLIWGSFDGSTNAPIAYPSGTSIHALENQVLLQATPPPPTLPAATRHVFYSQQFTAIGGQPPYTWSLSPLSQSGLPPGLTLSADGLLSGTPSSAGVYDFGIRLMDSSNRTTDWDYTLTINP